MLDGSSFRQLSTHLTPDPVSVGKVNSFSLHDVYSYEPPHDTPAYPMGISLVIDTNDPQPKIVRGEQFDDRGVDGWAARCREPAQAGIVSHGLTPTAVQ